ncbi:MAG: transposase [Actinobacteria bacterium]|nr:transposase [Actinomycetota bacterium]
MGKTRRKFSREFKISLLRDLEAGTSVAEVTRRSEVHPCLLARWKKEFSEDPERAFRSNGNTIYKEQMNVAKLQQLVGQLYAENDFLKKALSTLETKMAEEHKRQGR